MNILVLAEAGSMRNATLWGALRENHDIELRHFDKAGLAQAVESVEPRDYDRIVLCGGFRRGGPDVLELAKLPELVIYDLDLQQDYMPESKYYRLFPPLLKQLPCISLIVTSLAALEHYARLGFVVSYVPKAYDHRLVNCQNRDRDIEFGFIGRTSNTIYKARRKLLADISEFLPVQTLRTADAWEGNSDYSDTLNRIRFFISTDAGFCEYHIKNFEAMAAGCVLCALHTSDEENAILGFQDMENVVLYRTAEELDEKVHVLKATPGRVEQVARAGQKLAVERHQWRHRQPQLEEALVTRPAPPPPLNLNEKLLYARTRAYWVLSGT